MIRTDSSRDTSCSLPADRGTRRWVSSIRSIRSCNALARLGRLHPPISRRTLPIFAVTCWSAAFRLRTRPTSPDRPACTRPISSSTRRMSSAALVRSISLGMPSRAR